MNLVALISLILTTLFILVLLILMGKAKNKSQLKNSFFFSCVCLLICCTGQILQIVFCNIYNISPIYFDYFVYIGNCFSPIAFLFITLSFINTKIQFTKKYLPLFIIPILSLLLLWTNNYHHLFYKFYSINLNETITGPWAIVHSVYTYVLYAISFFMLIRYSVKNSGFFSNQAILLLIGTLIPLITNLLGLFGIIHISIYITPITFAFTMFFVALAIFKFNFLKISPIALRRIVDNMSDSYLILNEDFIITDFNKTFLDTFSLSADTVRNKNVLDLLNKSKHLKSIAKKFEKLVLKVNETHKPINIETNFESINKFFRVEINNITNKGVSLGTLVLLKDTTQHNIDMQTIKDNQETLIEKERLSSLGQMIGGIAHNLKTPIMSIAGAMEGLSDLVKEYDSSIGDSNVTNDDHHEIAKDMQEWIEKTRVHLAYMSDIITAVKGQAVNFSDNTFNGFTVEELVKHVDILMKHELKNALITMQTTILLNKDTQVPGNINSLVQVVNNIISNAIQAYAGKPNQTILFDLDKQDNNLIIKIQDFAGGLPKEVEEKLFKEMVTTKGKNGTGLGLFMSYSNIKAHFNGTLNFKTKQGDGTTFIISIPLVK